MRAPPAGRPTPELAGDCFEELFNTVGTYVFILDFGGYVSEVPRGSGTMVWDLVFVFWALLAWFIAFVSFSSATPYVQPEVSSSWSLVACWRSWNGFLSPSAHRTDLHSQ